MQVSEYYNSSCKTKAAYNALIKEKTRYSVLNAVLRDMADMLVKNIPVENILKAISDSLVAGYTDKMFSYEWQKEQAVLDDVACVRRFMEWMGDVEVLAANRKVTVNSQKLSLSTNVGLITKEKNGYIAYVFHWKKADKSPGGKDIHTSTNTDLYALVSKIALDDEYPGIKVRLVFMTNDSDSPGMISPFKALTTRKSNVFTLSFDNLTEDGTFDKQEGLNLLKALLNAPLPAPKCFACDCRALCGENTLQNMSHARSKNTVSEQTSYVIPEFTASQKRVVQHKDGPMLVGAGPGSGKTATLVGRIRYLISEGIPPEFILAITFTRDAAGELLKRCQSFCESDELPEIMTLNALGYSLITHNEAYVGRNVRLLSQMEKMRIIEELISVSPPLKGFSYGVITGKNGLLMTMARRLEEFKALEKGSQRAFLDKSGLGMDFVDFYRTYEGIIEAQGYISYDEQITIAQKMLDEYPGVSKALSDRYKYIMVDEYQDINADQARFIYSLASHGNLVAVGDDDQSIYGFRGGSNKYMLEFTTRFPKAESIMLRENFRSTEQLVNAAQNRISKNRNRLQKEIVAIRKGGVEPKIINSKDANDLNRVISDVISDGYSYKDIAVLASKNATLETLCREVDFPSVLGKSYLIEDVMFRAVFDILNIYYGDSVNTELLHLLTLLGLPLPETVKTSLPDLINTEQAYQPLANLINSCKERLDSGCSAGYLCDYVFSSLNADGTASQEAMEELMEKYHVVDCEKLWQLMDYMVKFEDDTRIEPDTSESVLFITSHESKGMEWPVVLMVDDYKTDGTEETNRLFYVAMTRAKDRLYVFSSGGSSVKAA